MSPETKSAAATTTTQEDNLLDKILDRTKPLNDKERERNKDYVGQFLKQIVQPGQVVSKDVETNIKYWIAEIDKKLSSQLNEVMHAPEFQQLEATWRGFDYLVNQSETVAKLKIRFVND